jgi:hypothetical protein
MGAGYDKVLILNTIYKGKGHTKSNLNNPAPRMERCRPPKIHGPLGMMEFRDNNTEEEKDEPCGEFVVTLKQKIAALEEQVTELHLASMTKRMTSACSVRPPLAS